MSFFDKIGLSKLRDGLSKTKNDLFDKVSRLINAKSTIDEEFLDRLEEIFITSDMGIDTAELIINNIKDKVKEDKYVNQQELMDTITEELLTVFQNSTTKFTAFDFQLPYKPYVIMIIGVNGVGKTTSIGKLAYNFKKTGKSVLIGSADTFRAAANEQLEIWAKRAEVEIIKNPSTKDPASVAFDTVKASVARNIDVVIIDTAGRLHNKTHLMEELKKIKRVIEKVIPDSPHEIFIVIDANTGQNGLNQVKEFSNALSKVTGIILTKLDGTAKGGIVIRISKELNIPVRFIGVGEKIDDLQVFDSNNFIKAIFEQ